MAEDDPNDVLKQISEQLTHKETVRPRTVREILSWFGQRRRGAYVVDRIRRELEKNKLVTIPDFEGAYIDSEVAFALKPSEAENVKTSKQPAGEKQEDSSVLRIRLLESANKSPRSVSPNTTISEAMTIMIRHDFAQLPVMVGPRDVKGLFSVAEFAKSAAFGGNPKEVRECMKPAKIIADDTPFLSAIRDIVENNCVLVKKQDGTISGLVTQTDLSRQFRDMTEPFLLLGQIEKQVRSLLFDRCELSDAEIAATSKALPPHATSKKLTFGTYQRILQDGKNWKRAKTAYNLKVILDGLEEVREIRNDIMHFNPDPKNEDEDSSLETLRGFVSLMESVLNSPATTIECGETL